MSITLSISEAEGLGLRVDDCLSAVFWLQEIVAKRKISRMRRINSFG